MTEEFTISKWRNSMQRLCNLDEHPLPTRFATLDVTEEMVVQMTSMIAIIDAMTPEELSDVSLLDDETRRQRIAHEIRVDTNLVASTIAQYYEIAKTMQIKGDFQHQYFVELPPRRKLAT